MAVGAVALVWICGLQSGCTGTREPVKEKAAEPAKITQFYASPAVIEVGEEALLCYGVENAEWVRLDPPVEQLNPSLSRCIKVKPAATMKYRLLVPGGEQAVEVTVTPATAKTKKMKAPHLIRLFVADTKTAKPGQRVTLCYGVLQAKSVQLDPGKQKLDISDSRCIQQTVRETTKFELTVVGLDGSSEVTDVTVTVNP
jgi:hypothetical protein